MTITTLTLPGATELLNRARDLQEDLESSFEWMAREKFENEYPVLFGDLSRAIREYRDAARTAYFRDLNKFEYEVLTAERERLVELLAHTYELWFGKWHACDSCGARRSPYESPERRCSTCDH